MFHFLEEYAKHSALNFGQVCQGLRYLFSHPDFDSVAARGTLRHALLSVRLRSKRIANDLLFTLLPPQWHHTPEELAPMTKISSLTWFRCGYSPWRFAETGELLATLPVDIDKRWDPRCTSGPST